jgi:hypothetical protein
VALLILHKHPKINTWVEDLAEQSVKNSFQILLPPVMGEGERR